MERTACQYALVRFMPYVNTGEFVNAGVLLWAPRSRYLGYKLLQDKSRRITEFFEYLDPSIFCESMRVQANEFARVKRLVSEDLSYDPRTKSEVDWRDDVFQELIRPRETIICYSEQRMVLSENPQGTLERLYEYYVGRKIEAKSNFI
ncbi:DUF3037 domain-containing protein [Allohahella marinimesophila]|uniref:DUF3037 domain-containing protein n=1 Tax=Allohahella marinimesophila TaxID=1054972 RepID=A0ABP7NUC6_9GAMM